MVEQGSGRTRVYELSRAGPTTSNGSIRIGGESVTITLNLADKASFIRLAGRLFLRELLDDAERPYARFSTKADARTALTHLGSSEGAWLSVPELDQWSRWTEQYVATRAAPTPDLEAAFASFHRWIGGRQATAMPSKAPPAEIQAILHRLAASDGGVMTDAEADTYHRWRATLASSEKAPARADLPDEVGDVLRRFFDPGGPLDEVERSGRAHLLADVKAKLLRVGLPDEEADANAALMASRYAARAARSRMLGASTADDANPGAPRSLIVSAVEGADPARGSRFKPDKDPAVDRPPHSRPRNGTTEAWSVRDDRDHLAPTTETPQPQFEMGAVFSVDLRPGTATHVDLGAPVKLSVDKPRQAGPSVASTTTAAKTAKPEAELERIRQSLYPTDGPRLIRWNGIGTTMLGVLRDDRLTPKYYSMLWFTLVFVPLIPIGVYLVSTPVNQHGVELNGYRFHARMNWEDFKRYYPGRAWSLVGRSLLQGVLGLVVGAALILALIYMVYLISGDQRPFFG